MAIETAWVEFAPGNPPTVRAGKKINDVSRNGVGDYSINLTDDLLSTSAQAQATAGGFASAAAGNRYHTKCEIVSTRQVRVRVRDVAADLVDPPELSVWVKTDENTSVGA